MKGTGKVYKIEAAVETRRKLDKMDSNQDAKMHSCGKTAPVGYPLQV